MKILIIGGLGMLGHRLYLDLNRSFETWVTVRDPVLPGQFRTLLDPDHVVPCVDVLNFDRVAYSLAMIRPDLVINCAGLIKQRDPAPIAAISVNSLFPHRLALACQAAGIRLVQISTDCVFSGSRGSYVESDRPDPVDLYGLTKYLGEIVAPGLTLRTSLIGREVRGHLGLVDWFLSHPDGSQVQGWTGALFSGVTTSELARIMIEIVIPRPGLMGVYHVSADPISKYHLLNLVRSATGREIRIDPDDRVQVDRTLDPSRFRLATDHHPPTWEDMIQDLADLGVYYSIF